MGDSFFRSLTAHQQYLLKKYSEAVEKSPPRLGLTAANERLRFWDRHVLDALAMIQSLPKEWKTANLKVIDVGTGNGVPGLPIAIVLPDWRVNMLDSDNKKVGFLDTFCIFSEINNVSFSTERAEKLAHNETERESYDLVFARALGKLPTTLELGSPFAKVGGKIIVSHGTSWRQALISAEHSIKSLNIKFNKTNIYSSDKKGVFLVFNKEDHTPPKYPRRIGVPERRPL